MRVVSMVPAVTHAPGIGNAFMDFLKGDTFSDLLDKGTSVYELNQALKSARDSGASAAQIAQLQNQMLIAQQEQEYIRLREQREFMAKAAMGVGGFMLLGLVVYGVSARKKKR